MSARANVPLTPFGLLVPRYLTALEVRNYSPHTLRRVRSTLSSFVAWAGERGLEGPEVITRPIVERYARHLFHYRKSDGKPLSFHNQHDQLSALKLFFRWLVRESYLSANPASELALPKVEQRLPRTVLTREEAEAILNQPDLSTDAGVRDRAVLEVLYSCGLRRSELVALDVFDIDAGREVVRVRAGKHLKDRRVPIGERALDWLQRYLVDIRPEWVVDTKEPALFLNAYGQRLSGAALSGRVKRYVDAAELGKSGSCHLFRHTMATLMLEGGADLRFVQQMLGHASIKATQIYTHVSIQQLKKVHELTHPSSRRGRNHDDDGDDLDPSLAADDAQKDG